MNDTTDDLRQLRLIQAKYQRILDQRRKRSRAYYHAHKAKVQARQKAYYQKNKEKFRRRYLERTGRLKPQP